MMSFCPMTFPPCSSEGLYLELSFIKQLQSIPGNGIPGNNEKIELSSGELMTMPKGTVA